MNIRIKFSRRLDALIRKDLERSHKFAYERVGFISSKLSLLDENSFLVFLTEYHAVDDDDYIEDETVGARINGNAIRKAMQNVLDTKDGMFHVHIHPGKGFPDMSLVDKREIPPVIQNFKNVDKKAVHGILLMGNTRYRAHVLLPNELKWVATTNISVVGFPMSLNV